MTREFNSGKRLTFIPPFRIYLFTSFTYFFLLAWFAPDDKFKFDLDPEGLEIGFSDQQKTKNTENEAKADSPKLAENLYSDEILDSLKTDTSKLVNYVPVLSDSLVANGALITKDSKYKTLIKEKLARISENPALFKQSLFRSISITVFFLLPVFALLLYFTHFRKHPYYVEHLVYSVHFHTFIFLLFLFFLLASRLEFSAFWLIIPVSFIYFLLSLRNAYSQSTGKAFIKSVLIIPVYTALISIALFLAIIAGAIMA